MRPRRSLRPSRAGWLYIAITFGVGFAALNTGNNLLYLVLSLMLAFLVLSGFLSESALRGVRIERRLPREIHARRRNRVALVIRNVDPRLASFALVIEDRVWRADRPHPVGRVFALRVGPGETVTRDYALVPDLRGPLRFEGFRLSTRFPFGLFVKSVQLEVGADALVYPTIEPVSPLRRDDARPHDGDASHDRRGDGTLITGLREYVPGDSLRRVSWRQSARRNGLFVGECEHDATAEIDVELPAANTDAPPSAFEGRVRLAASEVVHHLDTGLRVGLRTSAESFDADTGRRHRAALLRHLALIEPLPTDASVEAPGSEPAR